MAVSIRSNLSSLRAVRQLASSSFSLERSFERLSSGQRINRASDDPAGLAIAMALSSKRRISDRALLNVSDGLSSLSIVDGALGSVSSVLARMAELAEQAASGTFSRSQRIRLDDEYQQLDREIRRITHTTEFNGVDLLKGNKAARAPVSVGAGSIQTNVGLSGDGRYGYFFTDTDTGGPYNLTQYDSKTKQTRLIASSLGAAKGAVAANGDIVYGDSTTDDMYYYNASTGETTQLTNALSSSETYRGIAISGDGGTIAFTSRTIYEGTISNATGTAASDRIYILDTESGSVRSIGTSVTVASRMTLSANGSYLGFNSSTNLLSQGDGGTEHYGVDLTASTLSFVQITNGTGSSAGHLRITNNGDAYLTDDRNLTGENSGAVTQLFKYSFLNSSLSQVTNYSAGIGAESTTSIWLSNDGSTISFFSNANLTGENSSGVGQAFRYEIEAGVTSQLTNYTTNITNNNYAISPDGNSMLHFANTAAANTFIDLTPERFNLDIEAGSGAAGRVLTQFEALNGILRGLGGYTLTTRTSALAALDNVMENISSLAGLRGTIGAGGSRLAATSRVLTAQTLETQSALGRLNDIDVAEESATLTKLKITQQVTTALLSQANLQPELALDLLRS